MAGFDFNRLPASGPMAQQAEQEYKATMDAAGQEFAIELKALGNQYLTDEQYNNKAAVLHGKHSVKALKMNRDWNQRMTQIREYEELGATGAITPEQSNQAQFGLSGYSVPKQEQPNYWAEHQKLLAERGRMEQYLYDKWGTRWGKTKKIERVDRKGKVTKRGKAPTKAEQAEIDMIDEQIRALDQYELALMTQMSPQQRKVNQLSRAMAMGPRVQKTPGVGGKRTRIPLGTGTPEDPLRGYAPDGRKREPERLETPGYKMTKEKAVTQARNQLGSQASKERVLALAKQIFGAK